MLEPIDRKILSLLQRDGRLTNAELAEALNMSSSACHRRVKLLEEKGVIKRYAAIVDRKAIGLKAVAFISVKLETHSTEMLDAFESAIEGMDEVVECYAVSGGGDYILKVVASDIDTFSELAIKKLARLPGVKDSTSNFILSTMKLSPGWPVDLAGQTQGQT